MSAARDKILNAARAAIGVTGSDETRREAVTTRLRQHPANLVPERAKLDADALLTQFVDTLKGQGATVLRVSADGIPGAVADYLRDHNLPARLRMGEDPMLGGLPWDKAKGIERLSGPAQGDDTASLSRATAGASETGTLFLTSGPANPTTLNFLPETHMVVIRAEDVLGSYEDVWNRLRGTFGEGVMPRTVNMVSGPSRTADIEQTIVMGAHGPRRLLVLVAG